MARSHNNCSYGNSTICSLCIVVDSYIAFQQYVSIELCTYIYILWRVFVDNNKTYICLNIRCRMFCPILTKFGLCRETFKVRNIKFHEIRSNGRHSETDSRFSLFKGTRPRIMHSCYTLHSVMCFV